MSRCQLSQNGFYELIPIILKSEHVILQVKIIIDCQSRIFIHVIFSTQGNQITPLELKIFSGQLRWIFKYWILNIKYWIFHQNTISLELERLSAKRLLHLLEQGPISSICSAKVDFGFGTHRSVSSQFSGVYRKQFY